MPDISKIDKNFKVETNIERDGLKFFDAEEEPFRIYGLIKENGTFRRMPEAVAKTVSEGVYSLHTNTAGGRVRFITDSDYIAISTKMNYPGKMTHFALTGSAGFDMFERDGESELYCGTFIPPFDITDGYESIKDFETHKKRLITINFPLYSNVDKLYIGISENACLEAVPDYKTEIPVVFYGSSITQGGCASRPGNSYQCILSRRFNFNFINLGFSGSAKGEDSIADYIANLKMSAFVYDYDYNAPTVEHLSATHERMFKRIREKNPNLPIIILSRPYPRLTEYSSKMLEVIKATYNNAKLKGDKNVYFIDGMTLIEPIVCETATVDGVHPSDSGFVSMAEEIGKVLEKII